MAYCTLVLALEAARGRTAQESFNSAVRSALRGSLPISRYHAAGRDPAFQRGASGLIERLVAEQISLDFNPFGVCMRLAGTKRAALALHASQNTRASLSIRTRLLLGGDHKPSIDHRDVQAGMDDPDACRSAHLSAMDAVLTCLPTAEGGLVSGSFRASAASVSAVAAELGLGSTLPHDIAIEFESEPVMRVAGLARRLGVAPRTMQRQLKRQGSSVEMLRRACMIVRAARMLPSSMGLTEIAHACGYADHAHMTRAFVEACEMPPSALRAAMSA